MTEKTEFVRQLEKRIKTWVVRVLNFCETLPATSATRVINYQLIKSSSSTGANHRASSRARSGKEFFSKMSITVEEADESLYWLEILEEKGVRCNAEELKWLIEEITEFVKILSTARSNIKL